MSRMTMIAVLAIATSLAACSDPTVAPQDATPEKTVVAGAGSSQDLVPGDTLRFTITLDPNKDAWYNLGNGHSVYFPNGEVCDPAKSTYGPTEWDKPCQKVLHTVTLQVTAWIDANGHPFEDFSPSIRFLPTTNPSKFVILSLTDPAAAVDLSMNILYCATPQSVCVNEAVNDSTLNTVHDPVTGKVWRRIKHFSGYNVAAGEEEDPTIIALNGLDVSATLRPELLLHGKSQISFTSWLLGPARAIRAVERNGAFQRSHGYILASG